MKEGEEGTDTLPAHMRRSWPVSGVVTRDTRDEKGPPERTPPLVPNASRDHIALKCTIDTLSEIFRLIDVRAAPVSASAAVFATLSE